MRSSKENREPPALVCRLEPVGEPNNDKTVPDQANERSTDHHGLILGEMRLPALLFYLKAEYFQRTAKGQSCLPELLVELVPAMKTASPFLF
jgi:hypothetical protein